jgi:hypothetical protein
MREKATVKLVEGMLKVRAKGSSDYEYYGHKYVVRNTVDIRDAFQALMERLGLEAQAVDKKVEIVGK